MNPGPRDVPEVVPAFTTIFQYNLNFISQFCYHWKAVYAGYILRVLPEVTLAEWIRKRSGMLEDRGSNPAKSFIFSRIFAPNLLHFLSLAFLLGLGIDKYVHILSQNSCGLSEFKKTERLLVAQIFLVYSASSSGNEIKKYHAGIDYFARVVQNCRRLVPIVTLSVLEGLEILLVIAGVELNPGPVDLIPSISLPDFRIISQNCRGLTECRKATRLLQSLSSKKSKPAPVIACLQETHCINKFALNNLFKGSRVIDDGDRNQRGVAILIPEEFSLCQSVTSGVGRWAVASLQVKDSDQPYKLVIASIYAPNCNLEAKLMFQDFFHHLDLFIDQEIERDQEFDVALTGDFNFVMDPVRGLLNRSTSASERNLASFVSDSLVDRALRELAFNGSNSNPFTWRRGNCFSQLDYMFASHRLASSLTKYLIKWHVFGAKYDHACIEGSFALVRTNERGRSFIKLFDSDIATEESRQWLRNQLVSCISQIPQRWDPHMRLEFVKTMLRSKTLELRLMNKRQFSSEALKEKLSSLLDKPIFTREDIDSIETLKVALARAEEQAAETLRIKAGVKWREEGERSTRYFLSRFRARTSAVTLHLLRAGTQTISGVKNLLHFVRIFYSKLYDSEPPEKSNDVNFAEEFFSHCPRLTLEHQALLARPLSAAELTAALGTCKDSAPGLDGIPYSYYKAFADPLISLLLDSWNYALASGELALSHRQSCLTLLPKKGKDLTQLGNWRPISLSACDLKIITKAYAQRLKLVLPHILCEAQAAYVPGRDISFNNRLLNMAKIYSRKVNEDFCIVSLDARKAFDSVTHCYLTKVLQAYDFPPEFIHMFQTLYSNLESVVQVNGHLSTSFPIKNGVKQGDALSCGLFVLAMDPLLRNILNNDSIEGILIPTSQHEIVEVKILAYADDVAVVCHNADLQPIFTEYERLSALSGLKLNADKTEVFNLTPSRVITNRVRYLGASYNLTRVEEIRICGITLASNEATEYQRNVTSRIDIMESLVSSWGRRNLTMNGRMILAKTFLLSQIVFPAQVVRICIKDIKKIERLIYAFVNGARRLYGPEQVARKYLKAAKTEGGINGVDVDCFINAIALRQFGKAAQSNRVLAALQSSASAPRDDICEIATGRMKSGIVSFLRNHPIPDLEDLELVSSTPLATFLKSGTIAASFASQYNLDDLFSIQRELEQGRLPRGRINCIVRKLPQQLARLIRLGDILNVESRWMLITPSGQCDLSLTKVIKQTLLNDKFPSLTVDLNKIHRRQDLPEPSSNSHYETFSNLWKIKHPALRALRLKLCYKNVYSNERRHRFGISDSPLCLGCGAIESVEHQLLECANARRLWQMFKDITGIDIVSLKDILCCGPRIEIETFKATIIKALIQIDRSLNVPNRVVAQACAHFIRIEGIVNRAKQREMLSLVIKLDNVS